MKNLNFEHSLIFFLSYCEILINDTSLRKTLKNINYDFNNEDHKYTEASSIKRTYTNQSEISILKYKLKSDATGNGC